MIAGSARVHPVLPTPECEIEKVIGRVYARPCRWSAIAPEKRADTIAVPLMVHARMASVRLESSLILHRSGRLVEAEAGYRDCLAMGDHAAGVPLGALLIGQSRFDEAVQLLEPLACASPDHVDLAINLSVALRRSGRLEQAMETARDAVRLAPANIAACNAVGLAALELGRLDEALAAFETGVRLSPANLALAVHRARCLHRLGRSADARDAFERVSQDHPQRVEGWRGLADVQSALGDANAALLGRERALALAPHDAQVALEYAVALMQAGDPAASAIRLERHVAVHADDAQAWMWLGRTRLKLGHLPAARLAIEQAWQRDARDPVIGHFHAAVTGALPDAVESDYIRRLFDDFADRFEHTLVDRLAYVTPARLAQFVRRHGADGGDSVLDLGCGTGLLAAELAREGRVIDGVDLSPRMLQHARAKGLYRQLHASELVAFLIDARSEWELITATDVFIYVANLQPVYDALLPRLAPGGWFAFSLERSADEATQLPAATGRYRHSPERAAAELAAAGFTDIARESIVLRFESDQPVAGELVLARRPPG